MGCSSSTDVHPPDRRHEPQEPLQSDASSSNASHANPLADVVDGAAEASIGSSPVSSVRPPSSQTPASRASPPMPPPQTHVVLSLPLQQQQQHLQWMPEAPRPGAVRRFPERDAHPLGDIRGGDRTSVWLWLLPRFRRQTDDDPDEKVAILADSFTYEPYATYSARPNSANDSLEGPFCDSESHSSNVSFSFTRTPLPPPLQPP